MEDLPDWCDPLLDAAQMRAVDRWAIDRQGVPSLELMERAGTGVADAVERLAPDGPVTVVCGKGNNGGDGLVAARLLRERTRDVTVVCTCDPGELTGDARANLDRLPGERPVQLHDEQAAHALAVAQVVVDALLGTGFEGQPRGVVAEAIGALAQTKAPVVSVDVPSGVNASTGVVHGKAAWARMTVTFHAAKPGLWVAPGKAHAGEVCTIDIGIPRGAPQHPNTGLIGDRILDCLPVRTPASTKFTSGHVTIAGGSRGLMGAPAMAALAAMRAGAGYVTACIPSSQAHVLDAQLMEVMTHPLPEDQDGLAPAAAETVLGTLDRAHALVLGPGLGRADGAFGFARRLARDARAPTVIDADGLNAHAGRLAELAGRQSTTVLTPHAGELARLLALDSEQIEHERLEHVRRAAAMSGAVIVLKGDDSLIAHPDGRVAISRGDSPALATAGTGDVLSGVIASLLASGLDAFTAAAAGVQLHALAGREAARRQGSAEGVIASDVIAALPAVRSGTGMSTCRKDARMGRAGQDGVSGRRSRQKEDDL